MLRAQPSPRNLPVPTGSAHQVGGPQPVTLLDLVRAVSDVTDDDREVVATVLHMLRAGTVRLAGNLRDTPLDELG